MAHDRTRMQDTWKSASIGTKTVLAVFVCAMALATPRPSLADEQALTIGTQSEMTLDPHHFWSTPNRAYNVQLYGALVRLNERLRPQPMLAESWQLVNPTTWDFKLDARARFHDGRAVTAADIVASFERALNLPNTAASYRGAIAGIAQFLAIDERTVRFVTKRPDSTLLHQVAQIAIIPKDIAQSASQQDFISGRAAIGTGPYRFVQFSAGDRLILARNEEFFGEQPRWARVTFRTITDNAARVAALLGGDVDLIDQVPPADIARLRSDRRTLVHTGPSDRTMYLIPDTSRDQSPFVRDAAGQPLSTNPLKDVRVRRAMSLAMDRDILVERVMEKAGMPANQTVAPGVFGYAKDLPPPRFDLTEARKLLAEAGYPNGFGLTIHCTNDRYINDAKICQAVAQMLSRLGLKMDVQTMPRAVLFPRILDDKGERTSLALLAFGSGTTGDARGVLNNTIHSYDRERGYGAWNVGRYANPQIDKIIEEAANTFDERELMQLESQAVTLSMQDVAVIPLFHSNVVNASRRGIAYQIYADESTIANAASPAH
jgi:peptide/nickel transport system substrate-binding protein